jgi:hypothetical protein
MTLGSIQPLAEMSTRNLPAGKGRSAGKTDNLAATCEPIVEKMWEPRRLTTLWASTTCYRDSLTFFSSGFSWQIRRRNRPLYMIIQNNMADAPWGMEVHRPTSAGSICEVFRHDNTGCPKSEVFNRDFYF